MFDLLYQADPEPWTDRALCLTRLHPDYWFPDVDETTGAMTVAAHAAIGVCQECPVRDQCLEYAIRHGVRHGIWGGRTSRERNGRTYR